MRVVIDGLIYQIQPFGGISRMYTEILPRMCAADSTLRIRLLLGAQPTGPVPHHAQIETRQLDRWSRGLAARFPSALVRAAYASTRLIDSLWLPKAIAHATYYSAPRLHRGPKILTIYDFVHETVSALYADPKGERFRENKRRLALQADCVITISHAVAQEAASRYGLAPAKIHAIPLAYNALFRQLQDAEKHPPIDSPYLLWVGMRTHYKNFEGLLQAYARWPQRGQVRLVVVGGGAFNPAQQGLIEQLGIADRITHLLGVDDATLLQLYNSAAALVYPSLVEGFGLPILEALACGCPVVATRIPTSLEVGGDIPFYVDLTANDVPANMVAALDQALAHGRDPARVEAGLRVAQGYSWESTARQTLEVYRAVLT